MKIKALLLSFFCSLMVFSQKKTVSDIILPQSNAVEDTVKKHSVKRAAIFSAILPGSGQVYNSIASAKGQKRAYWKVPLIYAGLGATGFFALKNNAIAKSLKAEYKFREASDFTATNDLQWEEYDENSIVELYRKYSNQRNWLFIGMGLVYLFQIADAAVEAHFVNFDISENLTLNIQPALLQNPYTNHNGIGINLALKFKK